MLFGRHDDNVAPTNESDGIIDTPRSFLRSSQRETIIQNLEIKTNNFPQQMCVNNMLAQYSTFNCAQNDAACLCANVNFGYGLRDCTLQACGQETSTAAVAYGNAYCAAAASGCK